VVTFRKFTSACACTHADR